MTKEQFVQEKVRQITDELTNVEKIKQEYHPFGDFTIEDWESFHQDFRDNKDAHWNIPDMSQLELISDWLEGQQIISFNFEEVQRTDDYWVNTIAYLPIKEGLSKSVIWDYNERPDRCDSFEDFILLMAQIEYDIQHHFYGSL